MPAPTIKCEFCENHEMRRDAYAAHVKAKHMKEIGTLLLEECKEYKSTAIAAYAAERSTKSMPVSSKMYQDAEYWFGVKPLFYIRESIEIPYVEGRPDTNLKSYPEDEELRQYLKREENLVSHRKFIEEVLENMSMMDFIRIGKELEIRNPNVVTIKKELFTLRNSHASLEESSKKEIERLKKEVELWKETAEEKECIADLRRDLQSARSYAQRLEKTNSVLKQELEDIKKEYHDEWSQRNQANFNEKQELYAREESMNKKIAKLEAGLEKEKCDRTVKIAEAVQKALEKEREAVQKKEDKEREAKQKIKDKKALDKAKAKKAAKKAKKLAEMSDSDSDSGSDSD